MGFKSIKEYLESDELGEPGLTCFSTEKQLKELITEAENYERT